MKYLLTLVLAFALTGCTTLSGIGDQVCKHELATRTALEAALVQAYMIVDPVKREAALSAIGISVAALDKCPPPATGS